MNRIYRYVEQLDLAATQLRREEPAYARFALMLTDNVVELLLHTQCQKELQFDWAPRGEQPRFDGAVRARVLGQHFGEKNNFCRTTGALSQDEFDLIRICHGYRNELYHAGLKHESIVHYLAWHYHGVACELLERLSQPFYSWGSSDFISDVVRAHVRGMDETLLPGKELQERAANSLSASRPPLSRTLQQVLSSSAKARVEEVEGDLEFLVTNNPSGHDEAAIIEFVQFVDYVSSLSASEREAAVAAGSATDLDPFASLSRSWTPRHRSNPLKSWARRAHGLGQSPSPVAALRRFENLRRDMAYFETAVGDAARDLDGWIQHQIDVMRGK